MSGHTLATNESPAAIVCPDCDAPLVPRLRLVVESIRRAAKRPVTPELLVVCACGRMSVISLHPVSERFP